MKRKVKIMTLPKAQSGMNVSNSGYDSPVIPYKYSGEVPANPNPEVKVNRTLKPVKRKDANLEAEKGETVVTYLNGDGITEFYNIGGKRHYDGGTPLNLPEQSFIFSRDRSMKIKDKEILKEFGKNPGKKGKKSFTPAELSKQYNINKYRQILADPTSDKMMVDTAEMMIKNYNLKLGKLALVQESQKGFPDGVPFIAMPYLESIGVPPDQIVTQEKEEELPQARYGGSPNSKAIQRMEPSNVSYYKSGGASFKPHMMYNPKTKEGFMANEYGDHLRMDKMGYVHDLEKKKGGGEKVRFNPANGKYEIISLGGQVIGEIEMPNQGAEMPMYQDGGATEDEKRAAYAAELQKLQDLFDSNPDLVTAMYEQYKKQIEASDLDSDLKEKLLELDAADVAANFMNAEKQIYDADRTGILGGFESDKEAAEKWDKGFTSDVYKEEMAKLGYSEEDLLDKSQIAAFQAAYRSLTDLAQQDDYKKTLGNWDLAPRGLKDEEYLDKAISKVDGIMGNTTIGQAMRTKKDTPQASVEEKNEKEVEHLKDVAEPYRPSGWLRPDKTALAMATAFPFLRKKPPVPYTPIAGYTPYDPNFIEDLGALQSNLGQTATMMRAANVADPRMRGAMLSKLSSTPFAGQIIADIAAKNVQIANQAEAQNFQGLNLYDRYVAEKKESDYANWVKRDRLINAERLGDLSNWGKTAQAGDIHAFELPAIESRYPNMTIDRDTGQPIFTGPTSPLTPSSSTASQQNEAKLKKIAEMKGIYPQLDDKTIAQTLYPTQSRSSAGYSNRGRMRPSVDEFYTYNSRKRMPMSPYMNNPYSV